MNHRTFASLLGAVVFAAACGGGTPPPAEPMTAPSASAAPADTTPPVASAPPADTTPPVASAAPAEPPPPSQPAAGDWDKWSHDQKLAWMKVGVMPKEKQVWSDYDSTKYADIKCVLCHGAGAKDGSFKMPNPDLPKIPGTPAAFKPFAAKHKKVVEFMHSQVTASMASLLGEQPFDPKTKTGTFGCMACHTVQGK